MNHDPDARVVVSYPNLLYEFSPPRADKAGEARARARREGRTVPEAAGVRARRPRATLDRPARFPFMVGGTAVSRRVLRLGRAHSPRVPSRACSALPGTRQGCSICRGPARIHRTRLDGLTNSKAAGFPSSPRALQPAPLVDHRALIDRRKT